MPDVAPNLRKQVIKQARDLRRDLSSLATQDAMSRGAPCRGAVEGRDGKARIGRHGAEAGARAPRGRSASAAFAVASFVSSKLEPKWPRIRDPSQLINH